MLCRIRHNIGSGIVESGNKLGVEARLKGAGMHWERTNVNPMLGLRNLVCGDRWSEDWPLIARLLRQQARERQRQRREGRRLVKIPSQPPDPLPLREMDPLPMETSVKPSEKLPGSEPKKPAANHPWQHSPIGRVRYLPARDAIDLHPNG